MNKRWICLLAAALLLVGCGQKTKARLPSTQPETVVLAVTPTEVPDPESARYGVYSLDGGEETVENGNYDSDTADENALLARDGAIFTLKNTDVNKTGDGAGDPLDGLNAAAAALAGAALTLEQCTVTTNGRGASGLFASGADTRLLVSDTQVVTAGASSPALVLRDGAAADIAAARLMTEAADAPLVLCCGDASLRLSDCTPQFAAINAVEVYGGTLTLTLDHQSFTGDIALMDMSESMPSGLRLDMKNGTVFIGTVKSVNTDAVHIAMDELSSWVLTGEITVSTLIAPDTGFGGIQSNGFNIYYNAEQEANAWLKSQAYALPGGGFLSPLI